MHTGKSHATRSFPIVFSRKREETRQQTKLAKLRAYRSPQSDPIEFRTLEQREVKLEASLRFRRALPSKVPAGQQLQAGKGETQSKAEGQVSPFEASPTEINRGMKALCQLRSKRELSSASSSLRASISLTSLA